MIEIDVSKRLGDFELSTAFKSDAAVTALFGQSGAGKTSVIRMIGGLLRPDAGLIRVNGRTLFDSGNRVDVPAHRRRLGHVFQHGYLFPHLSVEGNLRYAIRFGRGGRQRDDGRRAERRPTGGGMSFEAVVQLLELAPLLGRWPRTLSGGEQQRVAIGRALLSDPHYLLMDEPLASLDARRKQEIMPYFERLCHEAGVPILYVSHAVDEVARLAKAMVLLSEGGVAGQGLVTDMLSRLDLWPLTDPQEAGAVVDAEVKRYDPQYGLTHLGIGRQEVVVPHAGLEAGRRVRLRIRARDVAIALTKPENVSVQNVLHGTIRELLPEAGPYLDVRIAFEEHYISSRITRKAGELLGLHPGQEVYALVKSVALDEKLSQSFEGG